MDRDQSFEASMVAAAIDSAVNAIIIIDAQGCIQKVNRAAETLFGYTAGEMHGRKVDMLMPEPYHSAHDVYMRNYYETGQKRIIGIGREVLGRKQDGSIFPLHLSVGEFEVAGARYFVGNIHDVSARVAAQEESLRQQTLFLALFESCPDAMIICDMNRRIQLCNAAATRIFGYTPDELVGHPLQLLFEPESAGKTASAEGSSVANFRRKSGAIFPGRTETTTIANPVSRLGALTMVRDISQEVAQEKAWRKVQRMEAVGQLTGGIAHDFNNLLTIITGNHELLDFEIQDDYQRDLLKRANDAAMMGARLTARLLTFARRRPLDPVLVNLNEHVLGMMDLLRRSIGETINLTSSLAPDLWPVRCDLSEVENAVLNLAINGRDAMPNGGTLILETKNVTLNDADIAGEVGVLPGRYVRLSVSDTGCGMPPEVLGRAFEPFFTTKEAGKGTGLGLSVIYGFAQQSGGHVTIYSEVGRGTTVNLYLPRAAQGVGARPAEEAPVAPPPPASGETVLVVEDQAAVRDVTVRRLQQLGYKVREADGAASAIALLEAERDVDLVFSDVVMPGDMTGFDLAEWVRRNRPGLPVVLTSGFAENVARAQEKEKQHSIDILRKPYDREELIHALERARNHAPQSRTTSPEKT
jgi:PAS domain S-box-containing protein